VKLYEKIFLATYVVDFGNVVINSIRNQPIKIFNCGTLPVDFTLDRKYFLSQGYTI
jgi:hydrocephalus-inducing protein